MNGAAQPTSPFGSRRWRRFWRSWPARIGSAIVAAMLFVAIFANLLTPYAPNKFAGEAYLGITSQHWLGTDSLGHDVFTRVIYGSRLSLQAGLVSITFAMAIGVPIGLLAGYFGGWFDLLVMRAIDVMLSLPSILVALVLVVAFSPSRTVVLLTVGLINIPIFCRQIRATTLTVRHQDYVLASYAAGAGNLHILARSVAPAVVGPTLVLATLGLGTAILEVAGLAFMGVAGQPYDPEWGNMLRIAKDSLNRAPACTWIGPGLAITLTVLGFSLLGDGLRDAVERFET
jgi:peptide/nickel transport system permease protein